MNTVEVEVLQGRRLHTTLFCGKSLKGLFFCYIKCNRFFIGTRYIPQMFGENGVDSFLLNPANRQTNRQADKHNLLSGGHNAVADGGNVATY